MFIFAFILVHNFFYYDISSQSAPSVESEGRVRLSKQERLLLKHIMEYMDGGWALKLLREGTKKDCNEKHR